jgi:hypothetical protein
MASSPFAEVGHRLGDFKAVSVFSVVVEYVVRHGVQHLQIRRRPRTRNRGEP